MATRLEILTFIKGKSDFSIHLEIDNKTALSYLLKTGGTRNRQLLDISKSIWQYPFEKQIAIIAEYLPSSLNLKADWESRHAVDKSEWSLQESILQKIVLYIYIWGDRPVAIFGPAVPGAENI